MPDNIPTRVDQVEHRDHEPVHRQYEPVHPAVPPHSLWFGFAWSAFAWVLLGCFDLTVTWRACMLQEEYGVPKGHPTATALYLIGACVLLATTIYAGFTSYRNWRFYATMRDIYDTNAVGRGEFMAAGGVLVALTMGMGMIWLALPPLFLDLCWRAR